jgi:hypothetical protein
MAPPDDPPRLADPDGDRSRRALQADQAAEALVNLRLNGQPIDWPEDWALRIQQWIPGGSSIEMRRAPGLPFESIPLAPGDCLQVFEDDRLQAEFVEYGGRAISPLALLEGIPA